MELSENVSSELSVEKKGDSSIKTLHQHHKDKKRAKEMKKDEIR